MTIVRMSEKGQIVVPKSIRDENGFDTGAAFTVLRTKSGAIVFRPIKAPPKKDLVDHLSRLKGVAFSVRTHRCPHRF